MDENVRRRSYTRIAVPSVVGFDVRTTQDVVRRATRSTLDIELGTVIDADALQVGQGCGLVAREGVAVDHHDRLIANNQFSIGRSCRQGYVACPRTVDEESDCRHVLAAIHVEG